MARHNVAKEIVAGSHAIACSKANDHKKKINVASRETAAGQIGRFDDPTSACAQHVQGMQPHGLSKSVPYIQWFTNG